MKVRIYPKCIWKCSELDNLYQLKRELAKRTCEAEQYEKEWADLAQIVQEDHVIAMRVDKDDVQHTIDIVGFQYGSMSSAYYYRLGSRSNLKYSREGCALGKMNLGSADCGTAVLHDWNMSRPDRGYGTFFLSSAMAYLKRKGFLRIVGEINPCDFDHEDKLRHLYQKLGFQITDHEDHRDICCQLQTEKEAKDRRAAERNECLDGAQWLQVLMGLSQSKLPDRLGLTPEQFQQMSQDALFQSKLYKAVEDILEKEPCFFSKYSKY